MPRENLRNLEICVLVLEILHFVINGFAHISFFDLKSISLTFTIIIIFEVEHYMSQKLTIQYKQLLAQFYKLITENKQENGHNLSKFQKMMKHFQQSTQEASYLNIFKKTSRATDCSLQDSKQTLFMQCQGIEQQNELLFTFKPDTKNNIQRNCQTINFKYRNLSIYKVLLYSILFNNAYLQSLSQHTTVRISNVYNQNQLNISWLESVLKQLIDKQHPHCLINRYGQLKNIIQSLHAQHQSSKKLHVSIANLINSLDLFIVKQIFDPFIDNSQNKKLNAFEYSFGKNHQDEHKFHEIQSTNMQSISKKLGIRIKLQAESQKMRWGISSSSVCYSIKKSASTGEYYLKEISYYNRQRSQYADKKRENYKTLIAKKQYIQI